MDIYIIMLMISIGLMFLSTKCERRNEKIFFAVLASLPFIIVSSIRYGVGTDYFYRYVPNYIAFLNGNIIDSLEPLFVILIKICVFFTINYVSMIATTSIIINGLIMITIFKHSKNPIMSIIIFFVGSFYFQSMNLVRQFIAMAILLAAYKMLFEKKKYLYIIMIGIATMFHSMSAIFIISLFLEKKEIKLKYFIILISLILVFGGFLGNIVEFIVTNTPLNNITNIVKYVKYFKMGGEVYISALVVETAVYIYEYVMFRKLKEKNGEIEKEAIFFLNMQTITLLCTIMNIHFNLFFRIALLFSIFQIISIPYFYFRNKDKELKVLKFTILILCIMSARMIYSNIIKGSDEVLPYATVLNDKTMIRWDGLQYEHKRIKGVTSAG